MVDPTTIANAAEYADPANCGTDLNFYHQRIDLSISRIHIHKGKINVLCLLDKNGCTI